MLGFVLNALAPYVAELYVACKATSNAKFAVPNYLL